jgi:3-oxoacyl-[acyl-carrier-protein] synthase III
MKPIMSSPQLANAARALELARKSVAQELPLGVSLPGDAVDLVKTGLIDSMGWVGVLSAIEQSTGLRDFGNPWPEDQPQSIRALADLVVEMPRQGEVEGPKGAPVPPASRDCPVSIEGWGYSLGALTVEAPQVERQLGLPPHTLRDRAGIQAVRRAGDDEDEVSLGQQAVEDALAVARREIENVDFLVATSTTFLRLPSFASALHSRLLLREASGALDVGGACVGFVYALQVAKSLLLCGPHGAALVVASEVHSRRLASPQMPGEFRGLFGDGACACVLARSDRASGADGLKLGNLVCGCSGTFASSLCLSLSDGGAMEIQFKGEQLAHAAVDQLARLVTTLENQSGLSRDEVDYFCFHEPNPRVIEILAQQAKVPLKKFPLVSKTCGNLGGVTCGVSLCQALSSLDKRANPSPPPSIFLAAVGPGLIWGGSFLSAGVPEHAGGGL